VKLGHRPSSSFGKNFISSHSPPPPIWSPNRSFSGTRRVSLGSARPPRTPSIDVETKEETSSRLEKFEAKGKGKQYKSRLI
jgi:hypothetical protein